MGAIRPLVITTQEPADQATAYWRAVCAAAAYQPDSLGLLLDLALAAGGTAVEQLTFQLPYPDRVTLVYCPGGIAVFVNGTTAPLQYLTSAVGSLLRVDPWGLGLVNSQFLLAALAVEADLAPHLAAASPAAVVYCGHSLGGAVATLLVQSPATWSVPGVWSIGQPRVGDAHWAAGFMVSSERWTTPGDPVPMLPPSTSGLIDSTLWPFWPFESGSYEHVGTRWQVGPDGTIAIATDMPSWIEGTDYLVTSALGGTGWYGAHSPATYACRIRQGIPLAWGASSFSWPQVGAVDLLFGQLLTTSSGRCPGELYTSQEAPFGEITPFAKEGRCR